MLSLGAERTVSTLGEWCISKTTSATEAIQIFLTKVHPLIARQTNNHGSWQCLQTRNRADPMEKLLIERCSCSSLVARIQYRSMRRGVDFEDL